jgi:hypothetical protein
MAGPSSDPLLWTGGVSGPRRQQQEDDLEVSAANDEARRLAIQLGVATTTTTAVTTPPEAAAAASRLRNPALEVRMESPYSPVSPTNYIQLSTSAVPGMSVKSMMSEDSASVAPQAFDAHGQRAPYFEGPYYIKFDESGKMIRRRWCKFLLRLLYAVCLFVHYRIFWTELW